MREQWEKEAMMRELEEEEQKKNWLKEVNRLYQDEYYPLLGFEMRFTSKDYYDSEGKTPKEFLKALVQEQQWEKLGEI